jgi:uncharacterized cupredoxin-like copper-binding protein
VRKALLLGALISVLLWTACGGDDGHMEGAVPGEAADEADATREVVITMLDELEFDPAGIEVDRGEVVTFVVENAGEIPHEFVLGDEAYQETHEGDMREGGHGGMMSNTLDLESGETGTLTWRFTESGDVLYACHEPGHYEGGMVGNIEVE